PECLSEMIEFAENISKKFPFVRVDLFVVDDKMYFGELTFTPAGGIYTSEQDIGGKSMGEILDIQRELKNAR
ncbi:ATP-grasp fold amidoligase family protein, partial [uncultured Ruminococcus sp.]|uniref:ATP-grasp fold amidoligase family protein n=1 Tax=uncultured Ruminococcus sp. TaxID=165186 RepID=UPI0025D9DD59